MASVLEIVKGLNQAAANAYDGYKNMDETVGLTREEGDPIIDSRIMDGFRVRFAAQSMIVTYQGDIMMKEVHPRSQFENEIEQKFGDIVKFLKKEYKKITKESVTLSEVSPADILVQSTSRIRNWVQATKQYHIGGLDGVDTLGKTSEEKLSDNIKKFMEKTSKKAPKPQNDKRPKGDDLRSKVVKQGYDAREDESLGMRVGKESTKKQSYKARREDSYGKWGKRSSRNNKVNK
jgi:hypothetical protein